LFILALIIAGSRLFLFDYKKFDRYKERKEKKSENPVGKSDKTQEKIKKDK